MIVEKKKFFSHFWKVIDFITALLSLLAIAFYAGRTIHANTSLNKITADVRKGDLSLQYLHRKNQDISSTILITFDY